MNMSIQTETLNMLPNISDHCVHISEVSYFGYKTNELIATVAIKLLT